MKCVLDDQVVVAQVSQGPLQQLFNDFAVTMSNHGYSLNTIRQHVLVVSDFNRWLEREGIKCQEITSDLVQCYLQHCTKQKKTYFVCPSALRQLLTLLISKGLIAEKRLPLPQLGSIEHCLLDYRRFLHEERGLAEVTIDNHRKAVEAFLRQYFGTGPVDLSQVHAVDVIEFVKQLASRLQLNTVRAMASGLRCFLKFAHHRYQLQEDLAAAVPRVANWSMPSIPRAISTAQTDELLSNFNQRTAMGRRDYAVVLLLARLGLRSSEIVRLELDDIDWNAGTLSVQSKGHRRDRFPLPSDVGEAIATYLQDGRQLCDSRRVFLRSQAPIQGFHSSSAIASIVRRALQRSGIKAPTAGAHQFRHGLATAMLHQRASLSEISDVLGHRRPQTTMIYAKVDLQALRTLTLPWPGGV